MKASQKPGLVFQPEVYHALQRGIQQMVDTIRPTLGPLGGGVAIDSVQTAEALPELLDDGGVIARRIIELRNRDEDMGAMLVRSLLVRQHEEVGDGTATTAVLLEAVFRAGVRYIMAGGNAMKLRRYLERAIPVLERALADQCFRMQGARQLEQAAFTLCGDTQLAGLMGQSFDMIGQYGRLEIREDYGRVLRHEYVQGTYFYADVVSSTLLPVGSASRFEMDTPAIFICNFEIADYHDLFPVLKTAHDAGISALLIITPNMSDAAVSLIATNNKRLDTFKAIAVKLPGLNATDRQHALEDISLLTGATPFIKEAGDSLQNVTVAHFGHVRRAWVSKRTFGLVGGRGDKRKLNAHLSQLEKLYHKATDYEERDRTRKRIGNLQGGAVTLWVGGFTSTEIAYRKSVAERTRQGMYFSMQQGVVAGGGIALLACRKALQTYSQSLSDADERAAHNILMEALASPAVTIWRNAGYDTGMVLARLQHQPVGTGFDVRQGTLVNMADAGIVDSLYVLQRSLRNAISTAALALTVDVLVHVPRPEMVGKPQ